MKKMKHTSPPISNPISAEQAQFMFLVEFVEFAEAILKGARPDLKECRKFGNLDKIIASKAAGMIKNRRGKGIECVRHAWLTIVQSLIAVNHRTIPEFDSVAEHLENPDLINPPPIYTKYPTPSEAAEEVRSCVAESLEAWDKEELSECSVGNDKWFAYMSRRELAARRVKRPKKP